ncbi:MAG: peptidoglycan DD-metalloendopeptidase family protein, partial [Desulfobacterales bacterium]
SRPGPNSEKLRSHAMKRPSMPPCRRILSAIASAVAVTLLSVVGLQAAQIGVVTVDGLNLRPEPGTKRPPIMQLKKGTRITIEDLHDDWLKVRHADRTGYVKNDPGFVNILPANGRLPGQPAAAVSDRKIKEYRRESTELKNKIEETETRLATAAKQEATVLGSLDELDLTIDRARRQVNAYQNDLTDLEAQVLANRKIHKQLTDSIAANEDYAACRLTALYKLNRRGTAPVLASSGSAYEMVKRKKYLERILADDERVLQRLQEDKLRLKETLNQLDDRQLQKKRLEADITAQIDQLTRNREERKRVLAKIQSEKSLQLAAIDSMKAAARTLDQTIERLAAQPAPAREPAAASGSFSDFKGLLKMPIGGKIISFFGPHTDSKFNVSVFRSGIDIEAPKGTAIQAVFAGRVLFADWFKGYGNMVIIDHADGYYTVYAHLEELFTRKGNYVKTGEDIATVGETASMAGPVLHFEVRHHGKPLDPMEWIVKG